MGQVLGLLSCKFREDFWIYSDTGIIKSICIQDEDKDAWKLYLDMKRYQEAYEICKKYNSKFLPYVAGIYADNMLTKGQYGEASKLFLTSKQSFEEICLKFIQNAPDGLEVFIGQFLEKLDPNDKPRRTIILTILSEMKINRLNELERELEIKHSDKAKFLEISKNKEDARKNLELFLRTNLADLSEVPLFYKLDYDL